MKVSARLSFRVVLGLLALTFGLLMVSGCTGGFGSLKPTVTAQGGIQGQTVTVTAGQAATFTSVATGTGPFTYQWYLNGAAISGATASSYTTSATSSSENGSVYTVAVTNAGGTVMGSPYILTVNAPVAITAQPASQTVTVGQAATFTVAATGTGTFTYQWYLNGAAISGAIANSYATPATTINSNGSVYTVSVTNAVGTVTSAEATLTVNAIPALSFGLIPAQTYGAAPFAVSATSASAGAVTYSVVSGPATIMGNTVTLTGAGTVVLSASQAANGNFAAATATTNFTVGTEVPALSFVPVVSQVFGNAPFAVSATSASSGAVTYSVVSGPATIVGNMVTLTGTGTVVLSASQAANGNFAAATATANFTVGTEVPTLTFAGIAPQTFGAAPFAVSATSASSGAVTYTVESGPATIMGNTVTLTVAGTVVLSASQAASGNFAATTATTYFTVGTEVPTLSFVPVAPQTFGNAPFTVSATSASAGAVTYMVMSGPATIMGNTVTLTGTGTVMLSASQAANGNFAATTATTNFTVAAEVPTLTFASIGQQTFGAAPFAVSATSASAGAVTYMVMSGPATIMGNTVTLTGTGTVMLSASQAANGNFAPTSATTSFTVAPEVPTLTFGSIGQQTVGTAFTVSATSASSGLVTYTVSGPATIVGSQVTPTGTTTVTLTASQAASGNFAAATATTTFTAVNSNPMATGLAGSTATPAFGATITLVPTFSGGTAVISSSVQGSSIITSSAVSGTTYTTPPVTAATTYTLTVTGTGVNNVSTTTFRATPSSVTIMPVMPANMTIPPGMQTFSTMVKNGATNNVTWSASSGSITPGGVWTSPDTPGTFTITATSVDEPSVSASTTVTISTPVITLQPVSKNACSGHSTSLSMAANFATSYQWFFNGNSLSGDTSPTLTLGDATALNNGSYSCTATNLAGSVKTNTVTLNVVTPTTLTITTQPAAASVFVTQTATFSVGATGTGTLAYQWFTNTSASTSGGTPISGATSSSYTTPALTTENTNTFYYVTVTDPDCTGTTLTSNTAELTVSDTDTAVPPSIIVQPVGETATVGGTTTTFSVTASGSGTLKYQWYQVPFTSTQLTTPTAGEPISGANSSTYTVPASATMQSDDGDTYFVLVTNQFGQAVSNRAVLAVGAGILLQITAEPQTDFVATNTLASFSTTATCTGCIPAYKWFWFAPTMIQPVPLTDGAGTGALAGATVVGSATSSLTLENAPATASTGIFYAVVTSTSDGSTQIAGTNPLTTSTAGLFVGSLGSIGNSTPGSGLCNTGTTTSTTWKLNGLTGSNPAHASGGTSLQGTEASKGVPFQNTNACTIEMTDDNGNESAAVYWPTLISTANFSVSFTVTLSNNAGGTPADGFTMVLADPSQGATTAKTGVVGEGIGAEGIPGFVLGFDTFQNGDLQSTPVCTFAVNGANAPCDPITVPYMAVGQSGTGLWENPWTFVNGFLDTQNSKDFTLSEYVPSSGTQAHNYVVTVVNGVMTVTIDTFELFSGKVSLPPAAFLGFTASTGGSEETVLISNLTATVSAP